MLQDPTSLAILLLILGFIMGLLVGWLITNILSAKHMLSKQEVAEHFTPQEITRDLRTQINDSHQHLTRKEQELITLHRQLSSAEEKIRHLQDALTQQKWEAAEWHRQSLAEFEVLANKILQEKSQSFASQQVSQMHHLLQPLQDKIQTFESHINQRLLEETKDRVSLKKEIEQLVMLNSQLSQDANNLADALKGNTKIQGDWGEVQLELLLNKAGLTKEVHYRTQVFLKDEDGKGKKPDFIVNLPGDKQLIIDAKVSLKAFERYFNSNDTNEQAKYLKDHLQSIRQHVKSLSKKNYQQLYEMNSPDYILLFIPIDQAFTAAQQADHHLFLEALEQNIVIVTNATLLATLRTVAFIWKQEKQKNNVLEIARQSGLLYDRLCAFVTDLQDAGHKIDQAKQAYHRAMNKLSEADRSGNTLIGRAEKIRALGAKASKKLPKDLMD